MDIKCRICGEPWDAECIHDEVAERHPDKPWYTIDEPEIKDVYTRLDSRYNKWYNHSIYETFYNEVRNEFRTKGCEAFSFGGHNNETIDREQNAIYGGILDLFGNDIDAAASATEEWDSLNG